MVSVAENHLKGKVAVVTGTSSGIGASIATHLVQAGMIVAGLARRKDLTEALAKKLQGPGRLYALKADVSKEEDVLAAFQWVKHNLGPIHVLINNAGIIKDANLIDGDAQMWKEVLDTNVLGLCIATREAIKDMRANGVDGHVIHINSILGHTVPGSIKLNVYPASKHAVTALTESLRQELLSVNSRIKVTSISPGSTDTEIAHSPTVSTSKEADGYLTTGGAILKSEDVANAVMYVLGSPPHVQIHEIIIKPVGEVF